MQKLKSFTRQRPTGGLLGSELEELARAATKKTLPAPDEGLIQQVPQCPATHITLVTAGQVASLPAV